MRRTVGASHAKSCKASAARAVDVEGFTLEECLVGSLEDSDERLEEVEVVVLFRCQCLKGPQVHRVLGILLHEDSSASACMRYKKTHAEITPGKKTVAA